MEDTYTSLLETGLLKIS